MHKLIFTKNLLLLYLALLCLPAQAQLQFDTFQSVLDYADEHAITIQSALIGEKIAHSEKKEAYAFLLPSANASLGYNDNITLQPTLVPAQMFNPEAPEGTFEELTFGTKFSYSRGIQAQWDILNFQKIFAAQTAKVGVEESQANTEINRYNTYNQLASTYYSLLLTQESIRIYEENAQVAATIFEHANEKFQQGIISEAELNGAAIKKLQSQRSLTLAQNNLQQFTIQLQSQLNTDQSITITDTPSTFALANTTIQHKHPEVIQQEAAVLKYEALLKQTKALRLPSISLVYQSNQNWATNEFMGFSEANQLPQQAFGIQINLSGLLASGNRQKIKQSKWQLELQHMQLANTQLVKKQEDELLQLQWEQAANQLTENKGILDLQALNDVHTENQYQSGIIGLDQRLDKYDDLLAAQDSYLQSLASFTLAQYKIYIRQIDFQPDHRQ